MDLQVSHLNSGDQLLLERCVVVFHYRVMLLPF